MKGKVTIQQIADALGLSKYAVSRAIAGKSGVSDSTRETILRTAGQLGYFKNNRNLSVQLPSDDMGIGVLGTIVVLFPNIRYQNKDSAYWGPIFDGISERLKEKGIDMISLTEPSSDYIFNLLNPQAIQGIITLGVVSTPILLEIKRLNIPIVMVDHIDPAFHADTICADNLSSMRDLMVKLVNKGYKNFQFVGHIQYAHSYYERWLAFRSALEEFQLPYRQNERLISAEADDPRIIIPEHIAAVGLPEVFVCANDVYGSRVLRFCKENGISVPEQCAVTGFDNTHQGTEPSLTTVAVEKELLGMRAVDKMIWRTNNRDTMIEKLLVYAEPLLRNSTR